MNKHRLLASCLAVLALGLFLPGCGGGGGGPGNVVGTALALTTTSFPSGTQGSPYTSTASATGGTTPYTWDLSLGALPAGLTLNPSTGAITGTPTAPGTTTFTLRVTDAASTSDTRALSILINAQSSGGSYAWVQLSPGGTAPAGRSSASAVDDPVNGRMVVALGSGDNQTILSDAFSLSLAMGSEAWSGLPAGPAGRWGATMVRDGNRGRAILYGGNVSGYLTGHDVWQLTLASGSEAWTQLTPGGTTAPNKVAQGAIYDSINDRMIVFGGGSGTFPTSAATNDVWALDFSGSAAGSWSQLMPSGTAPAARVAMICVYDANDNRMIVFGGDAPAPAGAQNDVWALSLTPGMEAWTQLSPAGTPPPARRYSAGAYDPVRDTLVLFGGENGTDFGDVWELSLVAGSEAWTAVTPTGTPPAARDSHVAAYDNANRRIIFYSGFTLFPSTPFTDVWALNLPPP